MAEFVCELRLSQHLVTGNHGDTVPRANLSTKGTTNTTRQIDGAKLHHLTVIVPRQRIDTVNRTD